MTIRRIVYQHTRGLYPGLHQILAIEAREGDKGMLHYLHTGEQRTLEPGPMPDKLAAIRLNVGGSRVARAMRLKTSDKYVLYQEMV